MPAKLFSFSSVCGLSGVELRSAEGCRLEGRSVFIAVPLAEWGSHGESEETGTLRRKQYIVGTKTRVAKVANINPPMTARASGAFCSPPSPTPKGHGDHAEDHCACRHQYRAQARKSRCLGCNPRIVSRSHALIGKSHDKNAVGRSEADAHQGSHQSRNAEMRLRQDRAST